MIKTKGDTMRPTQILFISSIFILTLFIASCGEEVNNNAECGDGICSDIETCLSCSDDCTAENKEAVFEYTEWGACDQDGYQARYKTDLTGCNAKIRQKKECVSGPICGNLKIEPGEDCDGAVEHGSCTANCLIKCDSSYKKDGSKCVVENPCGNGKIDSGEECDGTVTGGTCSSTCKISCSSDYSRSGNQCIKSVCGDGVKQSDEECDDGNTNDNDVCDNDCNENDNIEKADIPSTLKSDISGSKLPDMLEKTIKMLDLTLTIVEATINDDEKDITFSAFADSKSISKSEGQSQTVTVGSSNYTLNVTDVDEDDEEVKVKIGSQEFNINLGSFEEFSGGFYVAVTDISGSSAELHYSNKLVVLFDPDFNNTQFDGKFDVDGDEYEDSLMIRGSITGDEFKVIEIKYDPTEYEEDN